MTILLAALTSQLTGNLRSDFENYISEPGRASQGLKPKPRLTMRERVQGNSKLLLDRLRTAFNGKEELLCDFGSFVVQRCFLVAVSTPSQKSAFRVFSVLNNRGLDLLPTDIVKAEVIGKVPPPLQGEYTERWEDLEVQTGRNGFNDLFGHIRMIYARIKAKRALLEEFREYVLSATSSSENLIDEVLEPFAEAYLIAKKQQYVSTNNAQDINGLIRWLNRIDNSDWIPPAILFLSQKKDDAEYVLWFFTKLERLAAYLHICAKNVNQRIERYAEVLEALHGDHNRESPILAVELCNAEKDEFKAALDGRIYELTARRRNYLILRLDSFLSDGASSYDPSLLTIEHVLPQTVSNGSA